MAERNRQAISTRGAAVWLDADLPLLWQRVRHKDSRPLLRTPDPLGTLRALYEARVPLYALADLRVKVEPRYSIDDTADLVLQALLTRPDVLEAN